MTRKMEPIADWTIWDPVSGRSSTPIKPRMMTIHTAVTNSQDIYGPGLGPGGTHSHFYNPKNGVLRQHQEINKQAYADGGGNSFCVSVEHWDGYPSGAPGYWKHGSDVPPLTDSQIENDARLFAHLVTHFGVANRIATPDNLSGLGWHRLGVAGNFGAYNPRDRKTWSRAQSGANFSNARGKSCPGDRRIDQIQAIFDRAQEYLASSSASAPTTTTTPKQEGFLMALTDAEQQKLADKVNKNNAALGRSEPHLRAIIEAQQAQGEALAEVLKLLTDRDSSVLLDKIYKSTAALGRLEKQAKEQEN